MDTKQAAWRTPHGHSAIFHFRPDTSDWNTINAINGGNDEYNLPSDLTGIAVDVGAHIGACTVALLLDNPGLTACVAIEALPENIEMIRMNLAENGLTDRAVVIQAAAGNGVGMDVFYTDADPHHRFIGGTNQAGGSRSGSHVTVRGVCLESVLIECGEPDFIEWMKIDCEGCEYDFLSDERIARVKRIEGEVHFGAQRLRDILQMTHDVWIPEDFGPF